MKKRYMRILAALISTLILASGLMTTVAEASTKYYMPTKATVYYCKKDKWKKINSYKIKYNSHGDPTKYNDNKIKYKYYENGVIKKKTIYLKKLNKKTVKTVYKYNENGELLYKYNEYFGYEEKVKVNEKGWKITMPEYWENGKNIKFKYYKNGFPKKMSAGKEYSLFNKKGLLKKSKYRVFGDTITVSYKYKYGKKGKVKELNSKDEDGKLKVVFGYSKAKKTNDKRKWSVLISSAVTNDGWGLMLGPFFEASQPVSVYSECIIDE